MKPVGLLSIFVLSGCVTLGPDISQGQEALHHVVLCWLKEPGNIEHRERIMEVTRSFREIPSVLDARAGQVIASDRSIVDDSFDVGILIVVPDGRRLKEYLEHPIHQKAKTEILLPIVSKILVYDFQE